MRKIRVEIQLSFAAFVAAILTTFVLVSCAPTHPSFPLSSLGSPATSSADSQVPQPGNSSRPVDGLSTIVGEWVCDTGSACPVSDISILPDGSAVADGRKAQLKLDEKSPQIIHVVLSIPAHDADSAIRLQGDVSTTRNVNEITLGGVPYSYVAD